MISFSNRKKCLYVILKNSAYLSTSKSEWNASWEKAEIILYLLASIVTDKGLKINKI